MSFPDGRFLIGTSGWVYQHWKDIFYPKGLAEQSYLRYYSEHFPTVEINYSFYRLPSRESFEIWRHNTPPDFIFAVKASRYLTHMKKLREPRDPLRRFFHSVAGLGSKLGPILFQLPPNWGKNLPRLVGLLDQLPKGKRYAFEFRHPSWFGEDTYLTLSAHNAALVVSDFRSLPLVLTVTTNFTYIRLHGGPHQPGYSTEQLAVWANRVRDYVRGGHDVYVYFNNDPQGCALRDAQTLTRLVGEASIRA